jgi:hypothetical protein
MSGPVITLVMTGNKVRSPYLIVCRVLEGLCPDSLRYFEASVNVMLVIEEDLVIKGVGRGRWGNGGGALSISGGRKST